MTYDKAVAAADIPSHSDLTWQVKSDELMDQLPYYGEVLQRHVGFGTGNPEDAPEVRFGKIANPTVHICLNQLRLVVNLIIKRYGNPDGVVIEVARDLKLSREKKNEIVRKQKKNQEKREQVRKEIAAILECDETLVTSEDIEKWLLWEELNPGNALDRRCPYTGRQISAVDLLSKAFEIEHILPRSRTLDDSRANKTVSYWEANRLKSNLTPWEAREIFEAHGWNYEDILKELINFYNVLNVYGINHRIYYNDKNTYLILEGSIDQYDDLVGLYYHHDRFECWMGNMYMNNFLSSLMRVINLIPIQNFKYADTEECRDIWNTFQANPISKYEKSKINEVINETYPDENIILLESDRVYETNKDIIQDDGLIDIIKGISCIRLAISANRISEMDGVLYSDSATNIYTKGNREFYLLKIHNDFLYSFTDEYNDKELVEDVLSVIPDGNKYKSKEENIDNDSYYSDIDEIIE